MSAPEPVSEEFRVTTPAEIAAYLVQLQRGEVTVMLSAPPGQGLSGRITTLDADAGVLGLDLGADPEGISQALVASGEVTAVAYLGAIKLQFELDDAVLVSGEQGAVLRSSLPARLYRFQRRQAFRVQPSGSLFPRVLIPGQATFGRALRVLDISIGGLALALPAGDEPLPLGVPTPDLTLLPHHVSPIAGDANGLLQLGCSFVDLEAPTSRALQVYVDQTQKRRRLLKLDA